MIRSRTDSGPGWSSIATGAWPDKHGVVDNGFGSPQFQKFPDFLTRAKRARPGLTTSAFFSWAALAEHGAFGPAIDHRFVLDGYAVGWATADKQVAEAAERHLAEDDSDAIFVYLGDTDEVAHDLGPHCPEYAAALQTQDAYLGRLLDTIRARPSYRDERWTVLVTTDHGHVDEGGHGGTSDEERTVFVIAARLGADLGGRPLDGPRLVDVGPTALAALGVPIDPDWDLDGAPLDL
ncbi:alkaline phosphatase family protein [Nonomuraea rubra]|uniref:alkaline phosphatase family protein n=1 Tax=Nonomuraea rubra TaxID=46180 RepID=UPI00361FFAEB